MSCLNERKCVRRMEFFCTGSARVDTQTWQSLIQGQPRLLHFVCHVWGIFMHVIGFWLPINPTSHVQRWGVGRPVGRNIIFAEWFIFCPHYEAVLEQETPWFPWSASQALQLCAHHVVSGRWAAVGSPWQFLQLHFEQNKFSQQFLNSIELN